jgi:glycosyltransferase involved in cell wall biosynthesis
MKASLLFITYRHERFVAEAIRSAMAQDYRDLEIVVCDDASPDATRRILERELENCPPHIRVLRACSATNRGLHEVFNRGMEACTGEVIVVMSGDDVSLPSRVSKVVAVFSEQPDCMVVCSNWLTIDAQGAEIPDKGCHLTTSGTFRYTGKIKHIYGAAPVCGAAAAYRAKLRDVFGPMSKGHHAEDNCYWFRGLLMGDVCYLAEPLVLWRSHEENQSNWDRSRDTPQARAKYLHFLRKHQNFAPQWQRDLVIAVRQSFVSEDKARLIGRAVQFDREWQRLRRYSLAVVPMKLWCCAAKRVLLLRPRVKVLRKTILSQLRLRLSERRRARFWRKHFD